MLDWISYPSKNNVKEIIESILISNSKRDLIKSNIRLVWKFCETYTKLFTLFE